MKLATMSAMTPAITQHAEQRALKSGGGRR